MTATPTFQRFRASLRPLFLALIALTLASAATAQTKPLADWQRGTTLAGFVGAESASSDVSPAAGVALGWEVARHLTVEGRGLWLRVNDGPSDFAASLAAHAPLITFRRVVPFLSGGIGMYRATFNANSAVVPDFYRLRMPDGVFGLRNQTFQDFMLTAGGGASVFIANHFAVRPEVNVMLVTTQSDVHRVGVYGVQLVYHFESHLIGQ